MQLKKIGSKIFQEQVIVETPFKFVKAYKIKGCNFK